MFQEAQMHKTGEATSIYHKIKQKEANKRVNQQWKQ